MDEFNEESGHHPHERHGVRRTIWVSTQMLLYVSDTLVDSTLRNVAIIWREFDLFFGMFFFFSGFFGFSPDKFCDGNTADYLSCTRPTAYYHYDALHIALIILGAFFVALWFLKPSRK